MSTQHSSNPIHHPSPIIPHGSPAVTFSPHLSTAENQFTHAPPPLPVHIGIPGYANHQGPALRMGNTTPPPPVHVAPPPIHIAPLPVHIGIPGYANHHGPLLGMGNAAYGAYPFPYYYPMPPVQPPPNPVRTLPTCKVRAKGTVGKRAEPRESGSSAPSEHCGSCWDKRNGRAWLQHGCCAPMDCRSPISGGRTQE